MLTMFKLSRELLTVTYSGSSGNVELTANFVRDTCSFFFVEHYDLTLCHWEASTETVISTEIIFDRSLINNLVSSHIKNNELFFIIFEVDKDLIKAEWCHQQIFAAQEIGRSPLKFGPAGLFELFDVVSELDTFKHVRVFINIVIPVASIPVCTAIIDIQPITENHSTRACHAPV